MKIFIYAASLLFLLACSSSSDENALLIRQLEENNKLVQEEIEETFYLIKRQYELNPVKVESYFKKAAQVKLITEEYFSIIDNITDAEKAVVTRNIIRKIGDIVKDSTIESPVVPKNMSLTPWLKNQVLMMTYQTTKKIIITITDPFCGYTRTMAKIDLVKTNDQLFGFIYLEKFPKDQVVEITANTGHVTDLLHKQYVALIKIDTALQTFSGNVKVWTKNSYYLNDYSFSYMKGITPVILE